MNIPKRKSRVPKVSGQAAAKVAPTSTAYTSQGIATIPTPEVNQELGSGKATQIIELVPDLASSYSRLLTYTKMMRDAAVDVSIRAAKTPVLGADFFIEPYSNDQIDVDAADFVEQNLFGGMDTPFLYALEDILKMFEDGYSTLEKVYENRVWAPKRAGANGKTYTMLKCLSARPSSTITGINYDNNGRFTGYTQTATQSDNSSKDVQIDASKLLIFTFGRNGSDITGKSLLRTAYPHWYYKTHLYKIDAIQKERNSLGIPKGKLLPGYTPADREALRTLLRNIQSNEESFMILPPNIDVEFAETKGQLVDVLKSAEHHGIMILLNVLAQFLALGIEGSGGGRATGASQTDMFMKSLKFVSGYICDIINMHLIPELIVWNFPTNRFPKLKVRSIGETKDLQALGSALSNLFAQNAITADEITENWVRGVFDMPFKVAGTPGVTVNARQKAAVTLYDGDGNAVKAVPVSTNGNAPDPAESAPQNGNVKPGGSGKGSGNVGKSPNSAQFSELAIHMPNGDIRPIEVTNEYEHHIQNDITIPEMQAPTITINTKEQDPRPLRPKESIITTDDEGRTHVEYVYEDV